MSQETARRPRGAAAERAALTDRLWLAYLVLGVVVAASYFLMPGGGVEQTAIYLGLSAAGVAATAWGISRHRAINPTGWRVLMAGQFMYLLANIPWYLAVTGTIGPLPYPSYVDLLFNIGYALLVAGMAFLIRDRGRGIDRSGFLDTAIVVTGLALPAFLLLMLPYLDRASYTLPQIAVALSLPIMDLLMAGAALRLLLFASARRLPAVSLLALAFASFIPADTVYGLSVLNGSFRPAHPAFIGWLLSFVFLGAAALHPSMRTVAQPTEEEEPPVSKRRLIMLASAALLPPLLIGYRELAVGDDPAAIVGAFLSALVFVFALFRIATLMRDVEERRRVADALALARDEAVAASRLKSEFLATMSHEIRTPMNAVIGLTGLLMETPLDDRQREYADGVRKAGEGLLSVINDILDFSKIEAGRLELETSTFDLQRVLDDVADLVSETARDKNLEVFSYLAPDVPRTVKGDAGRIRQVLLNLMGNAVKFTSSGEVVARVRLEDGSSDGLSQEDDVIRLRVDVTDTGPGLTKEQQSVLFEAFSQVDSSSTRRFEGTGLGLAISKRLVERMGGLIGVDSEPGAGSTFWFTVTLERVDQEEGQRFAVPLKGLSALLVDDNPTNRLILEHQLRAWDLDPVTASGGREALARTEERRFDLALLDLDMPDMDGVELATALRAGPYGRRPIIMLTSTDDLVREAAARAAGVDVLIRKPVRQSHLYDAVIRTCLGKDSMRERLDAALPEDGSVPLGGHLLLVEDNPANQLVGSRLLERMGCSVEIAANGQEAVAAVARREFAGILMDCQMPEMDGYEATQRIRALEPAGRRVPIIAMTASALQGDRERALAAGMDDYVTKPVRPEELRATLARWMNGNGSTEPDGGDPASTSKPEEPEEVAREPLDAERWAMLESLAGDNADLLNDLVEAFVGSSEELIQGLSDAVAQSDHDRIEALAHSLKGSASNIGAAVVTEIATSLEASGREATHEDLAGEVSRLEVELGLVRQVLSGRVKGTAP